jgi:hypothetical protein
LKSGTRIEGWTAIARSAASRGSVDIDTTNNRNQLRQKTIAGRLTMREWEMQAQVFSREG